MTECATQTDKHKTNETKEGFSVDFKENDASNDGDSTLQNVQVYIQKFICEFKVILFAFIISQGLNFT